MSNQNPFYYFILAASQEGAVLLEEVKANTLCLTPYLILARLADIAIAISSVPSLTLLSFASI
jgi:hypothetical protein